MLGLGTWLLVGDISGPSLWAAGRDFFYRPAGTRQRRGTAGVGSRAKVSQRQLENPMGPGVSVRDTKAPNTLAILPIDPYCWAIKPI